MSSGPNFSPDQLVDQPCLASCELVKKAIAYGEAAIRASMDSTVALGVARMELELARQSDDPGIARDRSEDLHGVQYVHGITAECGESQGELLTNLGTNSSILCDKGPKNGLRLPFTNIVMPLSFGPQQCRSRLAGTTQRAVDHVDEYYPLIRHELATDLAQRTVTAENEESA